MIRMVTRRTTYRVAGAVFTLALLTHATPLATSAQNAPAARTTASLPARLTDQEFWKFVTDHSEPAGYFRSENLLSNETGFQIIIPRLLSAPRQGKVYLGVGPEQNFTYITAMKPAMAIIFDIRRGNLLEHLLYKALFELSADRAEFVSRLFSKPRPAGLDTTTGIDSLMNAYWAPSVVTDSALYAKNVREVRDLLLVKHGFGLSDSDVQGLLWVYDHFYFGGPSITYNYSLSPGAGGRGGGNMPDYYTLMVQNDGTGLQRSFLANEANWRYLKDMHSKNLIVPVVGDFGGPTAIRSVGKWLKERNATVTAFYASNVEQYLWQDGKAFAYYANVAELPIDSTSTFIRSRGGGGGGGGFGGGGGMRGPNVLNSIQGLLAAVKANRVYSYQDIFNIP